ncbi:MAG: fibronectin type III domain-containing protein [Bacteroidales bacterium]|nr:fibronectin type III domain-containing protein [Bacteroidales bacterium]
MISRRNFVKQTGAGLLAMGATPTLYGFAVQEQQLDVQPYLQNPAADGMTVMWRTADPSYSWIEYGTDAGSLSIARTVENGIVAANITRHKVRITGLAPDTKYYYRVCSQKVTKYQAYSKELGPVERSSLYSFTTLGATPRDFTCLIFTDLHDNLNLFDKLMAKVHAHGITFDFSIFNGDIFNDPASESQILTLISHYNQGVDAANKPAVYLRGNHEIRGPYAMQWPSFFDWPDGQNYFAFTCGDTRFVFLDNGEDKGDGHAEYSGLVDFDSFRNRQTEWLRDEVAGPAFTGAHRKILVHHIPIYSWNNSFDPGFIPCYSLWHPIFMTTPFDIDITGHLHAFRFHPVNAVYNPFPLVVGGGPTDSNGRVMVLTKRGDVLTLKALDVSGNIDVFPIYPENVTLTGVTVTGGDLEPAFDPQQTSYRILVPTLICTLSLTGEPSSITSVVSGSVTEKPCTVGETLSLTVTADDGTAKTYMFTVVQGTTSADLPETAPHNIKVYPNPTEGNSILYAELDRHYEEVTIRILNETGNIMQTVRTQGKLLTLPLTLHSGIYIVSFSAYQKQIAARKIIIQ